MTEKNLNQIPVDPLELFETWYKEFLVTETPEATAMVLSTVDENQFPHSRIVLLKEYSKNGFIFFTNYLSDKGRQIERNNKVSLLFNFYPQYAQIRIVGLAHKISVEESDRYFSTRPFESKVSAWASHQSQKLKTRHELDHKFDQLLVEFNNKEVPRPKYWGGYQVAPISFEFWQGRTKRLHDRVRYDLNEEKWQVSRLSP